MANQYDLVIVGGGYLGLMAANNAGEFLKQALSMLPKGIISLLVRADRGYFDGKLINVIESYHTVRYLIKVKMRKYFQNEHHCRHNSYGQNAVCFENENAHRDQPHAPHLKVHRRPLFLIL